MAPIRKTPLLSRLGAVIDRAIDAIAPSWGAKRRESRLRRHLLDQHAALVDSGTSRLARHWEGAQTGRLRDDRWLTSDLSTDAGLEEDLTELQARCSSLYRSNGVAHSAIEGRVANEVGIGLTPQARLDTSDGFSEERVAQLSRSIESVIDQWSKSGADRSRKQSLAQLQKLVCRCFATYGECFIELGISSGGGELPLACGVIAPERIETPPEKLNDPRFRMGVEYDEDGQVVAYWVRDSHPGDNKEFDYAWSRVPRLNEDGTARMLHVFDPLFPSQSRGVPWLAAAMNRILDLDNFFEAELIGKQIEACFGLIVKQANEANSPADVAAGLASTESHSSGRRVQDLHPGMIQYFNEGDEVSPIDPNRPGTTFVPFVDKSLRMVAAALNYPYELLAKDFFRTTYSSGRLALLDGRMAFRMRRKVLIEQFLVPLYVRIVHESVIRQLINVTPREYRTSPAAFQKHTWQPQGWGMIDPNKEVKANLEAKQGGIMTAAAIYGEQGDDWEDGYRQILRERMRETQNEVELAVYRKQLEEEAGLEPGESRPDMKPAAADQSQGEGDGGKKSKQREDQDEEDQ